MGSQVCSDGETAHSLIRRGVGVGDRVVRSCRMSQGSGHRSLGRCQIEARRGSKGVGGALARDQG